MEAIKFYDFNEICNSSNTKTKLKENQFSIYINIGKSGNQGTHAIFFYNHSKHFQDGYNYFSFAENSITGELFLIFAKDKKYGGIDVNLKKDRKGTQRNSIVKFLAKKLNINGAESVNKIFALSENLSKTEEIYTFRICAQI